MKPHDETLDRRVAYPNSIWQECCEINATRFYTLNFFSTLLSSTALVATVIELALIAIAPTSGARKIPRIRKRSKPPVFPKQLSLASRQRFAGWGSMQTSMSFSTMEADWSRILPTGSACLIRETIGNDVVHRTNAYLNNRLEQDHRGMKQRYYPMRGFGSFTSASRFCRAFAHDDAHDAFMTLPLYTSTREDETRHLRSGPKLCRVGI